MDILIKEHQELLLALMKHNVAFILIGGYAVIYYGYDRVTGDMDIWLQPDNKNKQPLLAAFRDFGIEDEDLERLSAIDLSKAQLFFVGDKPRRIDFLTKVSGVSFNEAVTEVNHFPIDDKKVPVIQYHHLILTKMTTGRAKDKADIEELQRINKYRK
jgi:predicted nucleotidyltransferase